MLKEDPALLQPGLYQELTNMASPQEGNLSVRLGTQQLFSTTPGGSVIHSIAKLSADNAGSPVPTRYIGFGGSLERTTTAVNPGSASPLTFSTIATGIANPADTWERQRFQTADAALNESGGDTYKFFACESKMLKDDGSLSSAQQWGIFAPTIPATAALNSFTGGPVAFTGAEVPYTYVYTYRNGNTGSESNPSAFSLVAGITPNGNQISVTVTGSSDPQVSINGIAVYRAGGSFADGLYRLLAYINSAPGTEVFSDHYQDSDIAANNILETDNDVPVTSGLPVPWVAKAPTWTSGGTTPGVARFTPTIIISSPVGFWPSQGDPVTIDGYVTNPDLFFPELSYVIDTDGSTYIDVYTQLGHAASGGAQSVYIQCFTSVGTPCDIVLRAYDAMFLAGAIWSPHILYKSKPGQPESWGLFYNDGGYSDAIAISDPSNPIKGLVEYGGGVIVLTLQGVYYVGVFNGIMQTPQKTPAQHGCVSKAAYCRVMNEVWYVSFDGIYSYSGGQEVWRSAEIDPLFHGISVGSYSYIDMRANIKSFGVDAFTLAFDGTDVIFTYLDVSGSYNWLRFNQKLNRWSVDNFGEFNSPPIIAQNVEQDTGYRLVSSPYGGSMVLMLADSGTSDNWTMAPLGGDAISFAANMQTLDAAPGVDKFFSDFVLEASNNTNALTVQTYYDFFPGADVTDLFTIPLSGIGGRLRYPFPFHDSSGFMAYACALRVTGAAKQACTLFSLTLRYSDEVNYAKGLGMPYSEDGYIGDKTFRNVLLDIDTNGGPVEVYLDVDGIETDLGSITTTTADRSRIVPVPSGITGKMVRVRLVPLTSSTKTNLYSISFDKFNEPLATTFWDSNTYNFGWNGYSWAKQFWLQYTSETPVTIQFYSDGDPFYSVTLPPHTGDNRFTERFYLPARNGGVLNKALTHRFTITASSPVRFYQDQSRVEWEPLGADQRSGYQQLSISELMAPK